MDRLQEINLALENLTAEFHRVSKAVKEAGDAFDEFQEKLAALEDRFSGWRRLYWRLKEKIEAMNESPSFSIDDSATVPPPCPIPDPTVVAGSGRKEGD